MHRHARETERKRRRELFENALRDHVARSRIRDQSDPVASLRLRANEIDNVPEQATDRRAHDMKYAQSVRASLAFRRTRVIVYNNGKAIF